MHGQRPDAYDDWEAQLHPAAAHALYVERHREEIEARLSLPSNNPADYWVPPPGHPMARSENPWPAGHVMARTESQENVRPEHLPKPGDHRNDRRPQSRRAKTAPAPPAVSQTELLPRVPDSPMPQEAAVSQRLGTVSSLGIEIQRAFRLKMFTLLLVQQLFTVLLTVLLLGIRPVHEAIQQAAPLWSWQLALLGGCTAAGLIILALARNYHPWNLLSVAAWSVLLATAIVALSANGGYISLQLLCLCTLGTLVLLPIATVVRRSAEGAPSLLSLEAAGLCAWVIWMGVGLVAFFGIRPPDTTPAGFASAALGATALFFWLVLDASRLCSKFLPDEYLKGVVFFYADLLSVFGVCLLCAWCVSTCEGHEAAATADAAYGVTAVCCLNPDGADDLASGEGGAPARV